MLTIVRPGVSNHALGRMKFLFAQRLIRHHTQGQSENFSSQNVDSLTLFSTFNRQVKTIPNIHYSKLSNDSDSNINLYCCGPTVYDHSHLGHAISYIRCDLVCRVLKTFCNMNVYFAMNITDIDDKIIAKSNETGTDYKSLSTEYYQSFLKDMNSLKVVPADSYLKVTDKIDVICDYIHKIYDKGFAYYNPETGDINFDYEKFIQFFAIDNAFNGPESLPSDKSKGKKSPKDFVLWKPSKPNEPKWSLRLSSELEIVGRPGWHVECSALSHHIFGSKLDIHFGGFDLIFPHHHCESCCSHAYLYEPTAKAHKPLYSNSNIWLHSGHLILRSEKMSKSLGNTILIKEFIQKYSPNVLRLLCIRTHFRDSSQAFVSLHLQPIPITNCLHDVDDLWQKSCIEVVALIKELKLDHNEATLAGRLLQALQSIDFDDSHLLKMSACDEKLREFVTLIDFYIYKLSSSNDLSQLTKHLHGDVSQTDAHLSTLIDQLEQQIMAGIADNLNLNAGLEAIVDLSERLPQALTSADPREESTTLFNCIRLRLLIQRWLSATGLDYTITSQADNAHLFAFVEHFTDFRFNIRHLALDSLKTLKMLDKSGETGQKEYIAQLRKQAQQMLTHCDQTRTFLDLQGIKLKDPPVGKT